MWNVELDHDVDISFARNTQEFNRLRNSYLILLGINRDSDGNEYGGYVPVDGIRGVISCVMFDKPISVIRYKHHPKIPVVVKCITEAQEQTIEKIIERMTAKGIIKMSKSGKMAKPMFSADEWLDMARKEVLS